MLLSLAAHVFVQIAVVSYQFLFYPFLVSCFVHLLFLILLFFNLIADQVTLQ